MEKYYTGIDSTGILSEKAGQLYCQENIFFVSLPEEHFLVLIDLGEKEPLNIMYTEIILGLCLFNP